jgi:hypothetical protein
MSRVLFTVSDWRGHYFCMVPLGWALQAAGHEVRVTCSTGQVETVNQAGLTPVPVLDGGGPDVATLARMTLYADAVLGRRTLPGLPLHPLTGHAMRSLTEVDMRVEAPGLWTAAKMAARRKCDGAVRYARLWRPDLVVHDVMAAEGALAARVVGVPSVYFAPGLFGTVEAEPGLDLRVADPVDEFERYGVGPWDRGQIEYAVDPSPDKAIPPLGSALRLPTRYIPYNGPGVPPTWAGRRPAGRRRVCVLWGNSATSVFGPEVPALRYAVEAAVAEGVEVVLMASAQQVEALGGLPPSVRPLADSPLHLLLETSDALIHHGSDNCYLNAAAAGLPQLGLALNDDQIIFGRRMEPTGASLTLPGLAADRDSVRHAVASLLADPSLPDAARALQADMAAQPSPADLVETLEQLASGGPGPAADGHRSGS